MRRRAAALIAQRGSAVLIATALLLATVCAVNPSFLSLQNFLDLLSQAAPVMIVASGMTLVVLTGEIDLSVGSLLGFLAALLGVLASPSHFGWTPAAVVCTTLACGLVAGLFNGLLVTIGRVPSIVATLGMLTILRGITQWLLGGEWIVDLPPTIRSFGVGGVAHISWSIWVAGVVAISLAVLTRKSRMGLRVRAAGDHPIAAAHARISVTRVKLLTFTLVGGLTGVTAIVCVPQQSVIESGIGIGFEMTVVTAVVVGGTSIRGGTGGVIGTLFAAILLASVRAALVYLNIGEMATYWERAIQGSFILAAVLADHLVPQSHLGSRSKSTPFAQVTS